jgi:hypothetical protein
MKTRKLKMYLILTFSFLIWMLALSPASEAEPQIMSPEPGTTLTNPAGTETFTWNDDAITRIKRWRLEVGIPSDRKLYYSSGTRSGTTFTNTAIGLLTDGSQVYTNTASGLPTDGSQVYVSLWYFKKRWFKVEVQYTAYSP